MFFSLLFMKFIKKFLAFCVVGVLAAIIEFSSFNLFFYFSFIFILAKGLALLISNTFVFIMNRNITFSSRSEKKRKQAMKYLFVYIVAFFVSVGAGSFFFSVIGGGTLYANIASVLGTICAIPVTFLGSMYWVFSKK